MTFAGTGVTNAINTGENLRGQDPLNEAQIWKAGADRYEQTEDILGPMEGGMEAIIQTETSTSTGRGHEVHFRTMAGFYGSGLVGEELFAGNRDLLEQISMKQQSVRVDLLRNGIENFFLMEDGLGMRGEIMNDVNENMGAWMGREKTFQGLMSLIHQVSTENHVWANGAGNPDRLLSGDVLTMDDVITANAMLEPMGGVPAYIGNNGKEKITGACFLTTTEGARGLKTDPDYKQAQRDAGIRGGENLIFKGGVSMIDGNMIKQWSVKDHDGCGAIGSPLNPKGFLGVPIVAGTTTDLTGTGRAICGGGNTTNAGRSKVAFWRFFPKFAFKFVGTGGVLSTTASTHFLTDTNKFYVTIVNPANAANTGGGEVIRNKWTIMEIDTNGFTANGNEMVPSKILGPGAVTGIRNTTVGGVTYDAAKNTMNFVAGALVYLSNSKGVPIGRTLGLYRGAMRRAYGQFRNKRMTDSREGGAVNELYIASIFGQKPRQNAADKFPAIMVVNHAISYPGWNHPVAS
jgi:hypothetical protein